MTGKTGNSCQFPIGPCHGFTPKTAKLKEGPFSKYYLSLLWYFIVHTNCQSVYIHHPLAYVTFA